MVSVDLALAIICFMDQCHPALVGQQTPRGNFMLQHQSTAEPGYGGDLLVFREDRSHVWAIHRVITAVPSQRRVERLRSQRVALRRDVTQGCINVMPDVFAQLVECCSNEALTIR